MTLLERQFQFLPLVAQLIQWAYQNGYTLTEGEAFRTQEQAEWNVKYGKGILNSLHCERLAIDLNAFKGGVFLTTVADYLPLGVFWESIGGSWGGRFTKPDADHFSLEWQGTR